MQRAEYTKASIWGLKVQHVEAGEGTELQIPHGLGNYRLSPYCNIDELAGAEYRVIHKLSLLDNSADDLITGLFTVERPSAIEEGIIASVAHGKSACRALPNCIFKVIHACGHWPSINNRCF